MNTWSTRYGRSLAPTWAAPFFGVPKSGAPMGLQKTSEPFKNKWFGTFWGDPFGETNLDHADKKHVPVQRGARFAFFGSVLIMRGARFWIFDVLLGGPTWPSEGVRHIYKPNVILHVLQRIEKRWCARSGCERLKYSKFV